MNTSSLAGSYDLANDIDASETASWNSGAGFIPIGTFSNPFTGTLDGQGYTINSLKINSSASLVGLFGVVAPGGVIKNVGLRKELLIGSSGNFSFGGNYFFGGLVAVNNGKINDSYSTGSMNAVGGFSDLGGLVGYNSSTGVINRSYATGSAAGGGYGFVGGLVGDNFGAISQSYATSTVTSTGGILGVSTPIGGLVGENDGVIADSYANGGVTGGPGSMVGGLGGLNFGVVSQSYSSGSVSAGTGGFAGGLIGLGTATNVASSYWDTQTSKQTHSAGGTGVTTAQLQSGTLPIGFDPAVWVAIQSEYPELKWQLFAKPTFPVVFVHGICSSAGTWSDVQNTVAPAWKFGGTLGVIGNPNVTLWTEDAQDADYYTITFSDPTIRAGIRSWAAELSYFLSEIKTVRGDQNAKFIIVAHSAGGLASRVYLQVYNDKDIAHLITYGTPHKGTPLAANSLALNVLQKVCNQPLNPIADRGLADMQPNSALLFTLNGTIFPFPDAVLYTSLVGTADNLLLGDLRPFCPVGWDCVVSADSQNILNINNPPPLSRVATRTVNDRAHAIIPVGPFRSTPGETQDTIGILWAIHRQ